MNNTNNNIATNLHIAHTLIRAGHPQEALLRLNAVLRADPQNAAAWYLLARALDDPQKKIYAYQRALRSDPCRQAGQAATIRKTAAKPAPTRAPRRLHKQA